MSTPQSNGNGDVSATRISTPLVWLVLGGLALISWTWVASTQFSGLRQEMQSSREASSREIQQCKTDIQLQIGKLEAKVEAQDKSTREALDRVWEAEFFLANPGLKRPAVSR